jgi:regulator of chromosome condensation (RCC1) repeat-containing protein
VQVTGLASGVTSVSVGGGSACALSASGGVLVSVGEASVCARTASGDALCWGENYNGQLGNGTMTNSSVPVQVTGLTSGVTSISVGDLSACAVISTGGAVCWGFNGYDELGTGTTTNSLVPVAVALPICGCYTTTICVGGTQRVPSGKSPPNWCTGHLVSTTTCGCVPG